MSYKKSYTILDLLIFLTMLGVLGAITCSSFNPYIADNSKVVESAKEYAKNLGIREPNVQCVAIDSDDDGYISCTASYRNSDKLEFLAFECASSTSFNSGCRLTTTKR